jgi:hypothetical protein
MGWPDHPIFGQGVASATPYRPYGGGRSHPRPLGVVRPPRKATKKKKKMKEWGWPDHPLGPRRGFGHPLPAVGGGFDHAQALGVVRPPPKAPKTQKGFVHMGVVRPPPYGRYGVAGHPLAKNGVVRPLHFLGKWWLQPP